MSAVKRYRLTLNPVDHVMMRLSDYGEYVAYDDHQRAIDAAVGGRDNEWCKMLGFCEAGDPGNTPDFISREIDHECTKLDVEADLDKDGKVRLLRDIRKAIDAAVLAERERCAKVAERQFTEEGYLVADEIRALPQVPDKPRVGDDVA